MPVGQPGANATANVGTFNDVNGNQKNITKSGNVKNVYNYHCNGDCHDDDSDDGDDSYDDDDDPDGYDSDGINDSESETNAESKHLAALKNLSIRQPSTSGCQTMIFANGDAIIVTTHGPGKLSLLSYQSNAGGSNTNGSLSTSNSGVTRFLISFSHHYERFAFIWEGSGQALYSIGSSMERSPVGRSWSQASLMEWCASSIITADVSSIVPSAVDRTNWTTVFFIPDYP